MQFIFGIVLVAVWVIALTHYDPKDGGCIQNDDECSRCPFPCDKRKN